MSVQPSSQSIAAKPLKDFSIGPQPPRIAPVPISRARPHTIVSPPKPPTAESGKIDSQPALESVIDGPTESQVRSLPPSVNRADKPKIPIKSALVTKKINLEPLLPAADERVSPFSTPPSSDESMEPESVKLDRHRASRVEATGTSGRRIAQQPAYQFLHGMRRSSDHVEIQELQGSDARRLGFTQGTGSDRTLAEDPPGLPPRRVGDQRILNASNGKQVNSSTPFVAKSLHRNSPTQSQRTLASRPELLPPPKRALTSMNPRITQVERSHHAHTADHDKERKLYTAVDLTERQGSEMVSCISTTSDYPEVTNSNRRHPQLKGSSRGIDTNYDTRLIDICGHYVCTTGHLTRVWDTTTGEMVLSLGYGEKETRVTALAFKPGANAREEGFRLWLGTSYGDIQEVDIAKLNIVYTKSGVHDRREIIKIYRHQGSMWTLDDGGKLCIWLGDETGLPDLQRNPLSHRVPKGHTFSIIIQDTLWMATGKDIRIFRPSASVGAAFSLTEDPLAQPGVGNVTSGAVIGGQLDRVYFGHADGKITIYSTSDFTCLSIVSVSVYKINSLAGAGFYLWAGYNTGMLYVYDTRTQPWTTKKDWPAHSGPILNVMVDRSSLWKEGVLRVVSLGADNVVRFWDGTLEDDWLGRQ